MSDSDETDLLLLIPPDFFMVNTGHQTSPADDAGSSVSMQMFLPHTEHSSFRSSQFDVPNGRTHFSHSTPKTSVPAMDSSRMPEGGGDKVIKEIDRFLQRNLDSAASADLTERTYYRKRDQNIMDRVDIELRNKCSLSDDRRTDSHNRSTAQRKLLDNLNGTTNDEPLMSLSAIWGIEGGKIDQTGNVHEERLRRQHCEQTIHMLQNKILEYEQKFAVALQVDQRKDEVLTKKTCLNTKLADRVDALERELERVEKQFSAANHQYLRDIESLKNSNETLQVEINRTLVSNRHLQECNELLEQKIAHVTKSSNEVRHSNQLQIAELEVRQSNSLKSEEILKAEVAKWKTLATKLKDNNQPSEEQQKVVSAFQAQLAMSKQQNQKIYDNLNAAKSKNNELTKQQLEMESKLNALQTKEKTLLKELETQRNSLKTFYQQQLDQAVAQKLVEFQQQVDNVEETHRSECRQRERLIAERAIRQMELINQKNEQEFLLLAEKHNEETDLYRIQLANARKTIEDLHTKCDSFNSKRTDMAERLHTVMETQWQRALEILASPTTDGTDSKPSQGSSEKTNAENEVFQTPVSRRRCLSGSGGSKESNDQVQNYIDLLLEKSPRDLDRLNAILDTPIRHHRIASSAASLDANSTNRRSKQQPWK